MDKFNTFFSPNIYKLVRLDWLVIITFLIGLLVYNWSEVNGWRLTAAFLFSDVLGTFPGMYIYHLKRKGEHRSIPTIYPLLYNIGHSFATIAVIIGIWALVGGWEWAMLAMPIHLGGDRGVFGNIYKQFRLSFEPVIHPDFKDFTEKFERAQNW